MSQEGGAPRRSLRTVREYIEEKKDLTLADHESEFRKTIALLRRVKEFGPGADVLEIGSGSGWFTILARREGYRAVGVEVSWELVEFARKRAGEAGIEAPFHEARAESLPLASGSFDVAYANSVMEHVKGWREAIREAHRVLRPGGLLFIGTTNRLYPISTEIDFPFYQWLPLPLQIRIAVRRKGPDVMENGLAWNHFTPMGLRRALLDTGFSQVQDVFDLVRPKDLRGIKVAARPFLGFLRSCRPARVPFFTMISTTNLWAIK